VIYDASASILTVLTAAATIDLTTLARAKQELGVTTNATDDLIGAWIHETSARIASACNRPFGLERLQEAFDPSGPHHWRQQSSPVLRLSRWPVVSIESISIDGVLLDPTGYQVDFATGLIYRVTERWHGQIVVIYSAGYELVADLPYDIEAACLQLLRYRQSSASRDPMERSRNIPDVMDVTYWVGPVPGGLTGNLPTYVAAMLQPYTSPNVA